MRELNQSITFTTPPHPIVNHVVILRFYIFVLQIIISSSMLEKVLIEAFKTFLVSLNCSCLCDSMYRCCFKKVVVQKGES